MSDWDTFEPIPYEPSEAVKRFRGELRFGQPSNITAILEGGDEAEEYVKGLIYGSTVIAAFFVTWNLIICIFMFLGRHRVGFLSGRCFHSFLDENERQQVKPADRRRQNWVRIIFILSGIGYAGAAFLSIAYGFTNLQDGLNDINSAMKDVDTLVFEAELIVDVGLRNLNTIAVQLRDTLAGNVDPVTLCPNNDISQSPAGDAALQSIVDTQEALDKLNDLRDTDLNDLIEAFERVETGSSKGAEESDEIDITGWQTMVYLSLHTFVPILFVASTLLIHFQSPVRWLRHFLSWVIMPIFIFLNIVAWLVAAGVLAATGASSDFCFPTENTGPETSIGGLLRAEGYDPEDLTFRIADFYMRQCVRGDVDNPYRTILDYLPQVQDLVRTLSDASAIYTQEGLLIDLSYYCGQDLGPLKSISTSLSLVVATLLQAAEQALTLTQCSIIVPIYDAAIQQGTCKYSAEALAWIFACTLTMGFLGTLMVTFRAAYKPVIEIVDAPVAPAVAERAEGEERAPRPKEDDSVAESSLYEPEPDQVEFR